MTISISIKVHDGLVLASDSATTLVSGDSIINVYNSANKIFNLFRNKPIAGMTWGAGSIGSASISTLAKELRQRFMEGDDDLGRPAISPDDYKMETVAQWTKDFLHWEYAKAEYTEPFPELGFLIAGYSSGEAFPEEWLIEFDEKGECNLSLLRPADHTGIMPWGQPETIDRLVLGYGSRLPIVIEGLVSTQDEFDAVMSVINRNLNNSLCVDPMPIQDVIDLAEFLVNATIMYNRFSPGPPTVGGPIEIAAITKYEGFKWVSRKHYYDSKLNPDKV
jgi:hypothetical protein